MALHIVNQNSDADPDKIRQYQLLEELKTNAMEWLQNLDPASGQNAALLSKNILAAFVGNPVVKYRTGPSGALTNIGTLLPQGTLHHARDNAASHSGHWRLCRQEGLGCTAFHTDDH